MEPPHNISISHGEPLAPGPPPPWYLGPTGIIAAIVAIVVVGGASFAAGAAVAGGGSPAATTTLTTSPSVPPGPPSPSPSPAPPTPTPTPTPTPNPHTPACQSPYQVEHSTQMTKKGLCIDDDTLLRCPEELPDFWPNTKESVTTIRLFKAWEVDWPEEKREPAWKALAKFAHRNNAKVLVGTQITCSEKDDDADWANVVQLIKILGPDNVMGIAVGNELELLQYKNPKSIPPACVLKVWGGYFVRKFDERVAELDSLGGFGDVRVTSVFGAAIMSGFPFGNTDKAKVLSFFEHVLNKYGKRWVYSLNIYPYFDPGNGLDPGTSDKCRGSLARSLCWDDPLAPKSCLLPAVFKSMRDRLGGLKAMNSSWTNDVVWVTETGWSAPTASSLYGANPSMGRCKEFSSNKSLQEYYSGFLSWDLQMKHTKGPDHVFYFTVHDSNNFGLSEHFGLLGTCGSKQCKIQEDYGPAPTMPPPTPPPGAHCSKFPSCKDFHGYCCPSLNGTYSSCCPASAMKACMAHPKCPQSPGNCCPTPSGVMLSCC